MTSGVLVEIPGRHVTLCRMWVEFEPISGQNDSSWHFLRAEQLLFQLLAKFVEYKMEITIIARPKIGNVCLGDKKKKKKKSLL